MPIDEKLQCLRELIREDKPDSEEVFDILSFYAASRRTMLYQYLELLIDKADFSKEQLTSLSDILNEAAEYWRYVDRTYCEEYIQGASYCSWMAEKLEGK